MSQAQPALRFTLPPDLLKPSACLAQPGAVPLSLSSARANLEIVDWTATASSTNEPGEFVLALNEPTAVGTVVAYGADAIHFESNGRWEVLPPGREAGRKLQFLALPPGTLVDSIRFTVRAASLPQEQGAPRFQATLPFATLLPIRLENIAGAATPTTRTGPPMTAQELIDGRLDASSTTTTTTTTRGDNAQADDVMLTWGLPQSFRGIALFRGSAAGALEAGIIEVFTGAGEPRTDASNEWREVTGRATPPGQFRGHEFLVTPQAQQTRALRLRGPNLIGSLGLGEIAVLRALGSEPRSAVEPKRLVVPKAANKIVVDGKMGEGLEPGTNGFALAWDDESLYLLYATTGPALQFENHGTNMNELFASGDAVELLLQTRAGLNPQRMEPAPGDVRLLFSRFQNRPIAVLYEYRTDDLLVTPVVFRSGGRSTDCDKVSELKEARVAIFGSPVALTVEASVPWKRLGMDPRTLKETRGDFGRLFANPPQHVRFADPAPPLPGDLAAGAQVRPAQWAILSFGE